MQSSVPAGALPSAADEIMSDAGRRWTVRSRPSPMSVLGSAAVDLEDSEARVGGGPAFGF